MCLPLLAAIPAVLGSVGAAAGVTGAGVTAATSIAAGTAITGSLVGGAVGAYGAYQSGQSAKAQNDFQSSMLQQQSVLAAQTAGQNQTINTIQSANESQVSARRTAQLEGAQRASAAANGSAGSVTGTDIKLDTFDTGKLDQMSIAYNANLKDWGIKNQLGGEQWRLGGESQQYRMAGRNAAVAGNLGAATSILNSASQVANTKLTAGYYAGRSTTTF